MADPSEITLARLAELKHAGHLASVEHAVFDGAVIASIFVNPTQFAPGEDYESYPHTCFKDLEVLASAGCGAVWAPNIETMYPLAEERRQCTPPLIL